jgi:hypothetical protein
MDINDLKSDWQNAGKTSLNEEHLKMMTQVNQHPILKKLRLRLILEAILLSGFLLVYYDGFDGDRKPMYINILLVASVIFYIANNLLGYYFVKNPVLAHTMRLSVQNQVRVLKRLSVFSLSSSAIYATTLCIFLASSIDFTTKKYLCLAVVILAYGLLFYTSFRTWKSKIRYFEKLSTEFVA